MASCNPTPVDLEADSAYRATYAAIATARGELQNVLAALGPTVNAVPLVAPIQILCDVYRANAIEKMGNVGVAAQQLVQTARSPQGGANAVQGIIKASPFHLCPQSLPAARL
jgi:hypothetical protein